MLLVGIGMTLTIFGFLMYILTAFFPALRLVGMDYFALALLCIPYFFTLYRISKARCWNQVNGVPMWKHLIKYLRRDNECIELVGERAYAGESFIDIPQLGLMEYLGKDCNYSYGDGKFVWGLENVNFTPDPHYYNFTHLLYTLGFGDTLDVAHVLKGNDLELMGRVYLNMQKYEGNNGVKKLVSDMQNYKGMVLKFGKDDEHNKISHILDNMIKLRHVKIRRRAI